MPNEAQSDHTVKHGEEASGGPAAAGQSAPPVDPTVDTAAKAAADAATTEAAEKAKVAAEAEAAAAKTAVAEAAANESVTQAPAVPAGLVHDKHGYINTAASTTQALQKAGLKA